MRNIADKGVNYGEWFRNILWGIVVILTGSLYGRMESDRVEILGQMKQDRIDQAVINKEIISTMQRIQQTNVGTTKDNEYLIKSFEKLEKRVEELEKKANNR